MSTEKNKKPSSLIPTGSISAESVKVIAESMGMSGLSDETLHYIGDDVTYRLKYVIQDAVKFMRKGKRKKLSNADIDHSLKVHNVEPLYGFHASEYIPFRHASGGGREIHFIEEKELDLQELINGPAPKVPFETSIRAHWLAIDGVQPSVPENPPSVSRELQRMESLDPAVKFSINHQTQKLGAATAGGSGVDMSLRAKVKMPEKLRVKELATHELSIEQQLYYKEVTEACVGSDETRRSEALHSLTADPGLHQMLPRFSSFISEGVKVNVVQNNLALLIYLMRMVKSLMDNPTLYLEKYLHELIPSLLSCVVSRQLCLRPDVDNHWALRDFAARLLAQLCKTYSTSTNSIQTRITNLFSKALHSETVPLASYYGVIVGLGELGHEVVKAFILPMVRTVSDKLYAVIEGPLANNADRTAADHIKTALLKLLPPVLKTARSPTDTVDDYKAAYGNLGQQLHSAVAKLRQTSGTPPSTGSASAGGSLLQPRTQPRAVQMQGLSTASSAQQKYVLVAPTTTPSATRNSSTVFQPQPATVSFPTTSSNQGSTGTVFRMVAGSQVSGSSAGTPSGAKILVVSMASDVNNDASRNLFVGSTSNSSDQNFQ